MILNKMNDEINIVKNENPPDTSPTCITRNTHKNCINDNLINSANVIFYSPNILSYRLSNLSCSELSSLFDIPSFPPNILIVIPPYIIGIHNIVIKINVAINTGIRFPNFNPFINFCNKLPDFPLISFSLM